MGKLILIVDDSVSVRQQVGIALGQAGFEYLEACDGIEGLKAITENPKIMMVVLDINMPHMDGLEMLAEVRKIRSGSDLPIIVLTTETSPAVVKKAKQAGATGWIIKPFNVEKFISAINWLTS